MENVPVLRKGFQMNPQLEFLKYLRFGRSLLACDEVSVPGGGIADVLAIDTNKRFIIEYEFKKSAHDLKVLENKKLKYMRKNRKGPNKFYFVVPQKLWKKESAYLKAMPKEVGVIMYFPLRGKLNFLAMKPCAPKKSFTYDYGMIQKVLLRRATSAYVALLLKQNGIRTF